MKNSSRIKIFYINHSSFLIELEKYNFIFDFFDKRNLDYIENILSNGKKTFILSSHSHHDHYNPIILDWDKNYIFSEDIDVDKEVADKRNIIKVRAGDIFETEDILLKVFSSTDIGVSFYLEVKEMKFFHCGDLNWWKWNDDTIDEEKYMKNLYFSIVEDIAKSIESIDYLFYPVDYRLEENKFVGIEYFLKKIDVKKLIPMHMWEQYREILELKERIKIDIVEIEKECTKIYEE